MNKLQQHRAVTAALDSLGNGGGYTRSEAERSLERALDGERPKSRLDHAVHAAIKEITNVANG